MDFGSRSTSFLIIATMMVLGSCYVVDSKYSGHSRRYKRSKTRCSNCWWLYPVLGTNRGKMLAISLHSRSEDSKTDSLLIFLFTHNEATVCVLHVCSIPRAGHDCEFKPHWSAREFSCQYDQRLTCCGYETYSMFLYTWLRLLLLECCLHMIHVRLVICRDKVIRRTSRRQPAELLERPRSKAA